MTLCRSFQSRAQRPRRHAHCIPARIQVEHKLVNTHTPIDFRVDCEPGNTGFSKGTGTRWQVRRYDRAEGDPAWALEPGWVQTDAEL
jgi:hypothetical protein